MYRYIYSVLRSVDLRQRSTGFVCAEVLFHSVLGMRACRSHGRPECREEGARDTVGRNHIGLAFFRIIFFNPSFFFSRKMHFYQRTPINTFDKIGNDYNTKNSVRTALKQDDCPTIKTENTRTRGRLFRTIGFFRRKSKSSKTSRRFSKHAFLNLLS